MQIEFFPESTPRAERYATLASIFSTPDSSGAYITSTVNPELVRAYWRLFQGPGRPLVQPYESVYTEGKLMGETSEQLMQRYAEAGIQVQSTGGQLPDHISVELAFMAYLARREDEHDSRSLIWRARQRRFLNDHLTHWAGKFCKAIQDSQIHPFFTQAACATQTLIDEEILRLTHEKQPKRHPNINLALDVSCCTLCTLCADNCRQGALSITSSRESLSLLFETALCNGCHACKRLCPESALTLHRRQPPNMSHRTGKLILISAPRAVCPCCSQPHIALPWLDRLTERTGDNPSLRASLRLCPVCKYYSNQDVPTQLVEMQE